MGSLGAIELTVLGEFKPFGLIAEALDGKPSDTCVDDYRYFLFSPQVTKQRDEADEHDLPSPSRQYGALVCESIRGEVTSVPLPRSITSIWPLPYGLLLQQAPEGSSQAHIQFSSLSPLLSARDTTRSKREVSTQQNYTAVLGLDFTLKGDGSSMSSHLILKDPLEEPQGLEKPPTETRTRSSVESLVIVNCLETLMLGRWNPNLYLCNSFAIMDTILSHLDAIAREIAKANAGLDKLGSDMSTILERLDRVESRRNSHVSTPEVLPQTINPPRPPLNDIDINQDNKCPQARDLNELLLPQFDQVQQEGLGSQFSPIQAP
ncbi:hypothetical protein FXO38_04594 [Capsicum annuum]|nr:hypothetical protein FXO38_04594 [Capsicum annuum]